MEGKPTPKDIDLSTADRLTVGFHPWLKIRSVRWLRFESAPTVIGKQVDFAMVFTSVALPQWKAGKVAVLGITSGTRNPIAPEIPTLIEQGLAGVEVTGFGGLAVPAGTPPAIVNRIYEVMREALARPDIRAKMEAQGNPPKPTGPEEFTAAMRAEIVLTERMMKAARLEAE